MVKKGKHCSRDYFVIPKIQNLTYLNKQARKQANSNNNNKSTTMEVETEHGLMFILLKYLIH